MNLRSRIHPREEHVAELTRGIRLPYPPLPRTQMVLIAQVLIRAWDDLLGKWPSKLSSGGETELNSLMEIKLNALRDEDVLWMQLVSGVSRGSETMSYNGSHLEKRPDLSIHLTTRNSSFSLIVECKLIDASSKKTI